MPYKLPPVWVLKAEHSAKAHNLCAKVFYPGSCDLKLEDWRTGLSLIRPWESRISGRSLLTQEHQGVGLRVGNWYSDGEPGSVCMCERLDHLSFWFIPLTRWSKAVAITPCKPFLLHPFNSYLLTQKKKGTWITDQPICTSSTFCNWGLIEWLISHNTFLTLTMHNLYVTEGVLYMLETYMFVAVFIPVHLIHLLKTLMNFPNS